MYLMKRKCALVFIMALLVLGGAFALQDPAGANEMALEQILLDVEGMLGF
ncbi:MAG: hypothetical protein HY673_06095 [Chloroflexi bacterium]|nr:hypothetical protein [Chloroflexota bacterium]